MDNRYNVPQAGYTAGYASSGYNAPPATAYSASSVSGYSGSQNTVGYNQQSAGYVPQTAGYSQCPSYSQPSTAYGQQSAGYNYLSSGYALQSAYGGQQYALYSSSQNTSYGVPAGYSEQQNVAYSASQNTSYGASATAAYNTPSAKGYNATSTYATPSKPSVPSAVEKTAPASSVTETVFLKPKGPPVDNSTQTQITTKENNTQTDVAFPCQPLFYDERTPDDCGILLTPRNVKCK